MIKETKDYSIFKKHDHNRELNEGNVQKIMKSIQSKNLLEYRPIMVDSKMHIIDGQHRLEAAKRLGIPIFYEVKADIRKEDMILLNDNSKSWGRDDYLNYYCAEGNIEYLKLRDFIKAHKISLSTSLVVLASSANKSKGGAKFKKGEFKFPGDAEELDSVGILQNSQEVINFILPRVEGKPMFLKGPHFRRALFLFLSIKAVDFKVFMEKLAYRLDLIRPCSRIKDFLGVFKMIYNWRNRNPVTLDEYEG